MTSTGTTHLTTYRRAVVDCASICRFIDSICCQRSFLLLPGSGNSVRALFQCKDAAFKLYEGLLPVRFVPTVMI